MSPISVGPAPSFLFDLFSIAPDDPVFVVPISVVNSKWFMKLKRHDRDVVLAYLHVVFRCCVWSHTNEYRSQIDPTAKEAIRTAKHLLPAQVSFRRLKQFVDRNRQCDVLELLLAKKVLYIAADACYGKHAKMLGFTSKCEKMGFTFQRPETPSIRKKLANPDLRCMVDDPTDTERQAFECLKQIRVDFKAVLADVSTSELSYVQRLQAIDSLLAFATGDVYLIRDSFSGRLHSPLTGLKKEYRRHIRVNGMPIVEIDLPACQPLLLANLSDDFRSDSSVREFGTLAVSGRLYQHIAEVGSIAVQLAKWMPDMTPAKAAKVSFLAWLFHNPNSRTKPPTVPAVDAHMKKAFPTVWEVVSDLKRWDHKKAARKLQQMEVSIVIGGVLPQLLRHGWAATVHDAVFVLECDVEFSKSTMKSAFSGFIFQPDL